MNVIIVDCFDTWEHRVDLLYKVFKSMGHKVRCLLSDYRHIEKRYRTELKEDFYFFHANRYRKNLSIARLCSHINLSKRIFDYIEKENGAIDLLWVLAPPNIFIRDAARIKRKNPEMRLVIDLIDLWPETMPVGNIKPLLRPWNSLRDENLRYADVIVTECNLYQKKLEKILSGMNVHTIYLAREDNGYKPNLNLRADKISLCYLGSINNIIDIPMIARVIESCMKIRPVEFHLVGDGERKAELKRIVMESGAVLIDHGKVYDRNEKKSIFDVCHFGLNIMKKSVCVGLTMKSIDYFEFGLPVINNIKGDTWEIIEKYGCGINLESSSISGVYIEGYVDIDSDQIKLMRSLSRQVFDEHLTEKVFENSIADIIDGL